MDNKLLSVDSFKTLYSALLMKFKSLIVKPDWNQSDESADDYIKNKPFGEEIIKEEILSETALQFHATGYSGALNIGKRIGLIYDESYIVVWDNKEYQCICSGFSGEAIGDNSVLIGATTGNFSAEAPFFIWSSGLIISKDIGFHTVKIEKRTSTIHKIDEKYLPELESGVKNWNDLEDKPFYEGLGYEICNKEQTFTCELNESNNQAVADLQKDVNIDYSRIDMPTVVVLDGVEYTDLDIYESGGDMCIYIKFTNENGDKIGIQNNNYIFMPSSYAGTTHTIEIKQEATIVKTIDKKYLPDVVSDWNQNDETALNYIKNKTHWAEGEIINYLSATTLYFSKSSNSNWKNWYTHEAFMTLPYALQPGKTYVLEWDGVAREFSFMGGDYDGCLGRIYYNNPDVRDGDFGVYLGYDYKTIKCFYCASSEPIHTIAIYEDNRSFHKLDEKYIPETIARKDYVDEAIANAGDSALKSPTTGEIGQMLSPVRRDFDGTITDWNLIKVLGNSKDDQDNCALRITSQTVNTNSGNLVHYKITDMTGYIVCEFNSYQGVQGNFVDLNTTDKTIVGAINELKAEIEALKGN